MEVWKDIFGYEGIYKISNTGKVKSIERVVPHARFGTIKINGRFKKFDQDKDGRNQVTLSYEGKNEVKSVAHLVAYHFLNIKDRRECVIHLDGDNSNDNSCNLKYVTRRDVSFVRESKNSLNSSKKLGVYFDKTKGKYRAAISIKGKQKTIGTFSSELEAYNAYKKAYVLQNTFNETIYTLKE